MLSPDDGCDDCGTVDATHTDCSKAQQPPAPPRPWEPGGGGAPCSAYPQPTGHMHCQHGHVNECPDQGECEIVDRQQPSTLEPTR